jgi:rhodanese-related sulfurtransferase
MRKLILIGAVLLAVVVVASAGLIFFTTSTVDPQVAARIQTLSPNGYQEQFISTSTTHQLIDVRTPEEFASGHIAGAINIPVDALQSRLSEVASDQPVVVYCRSGNRSATASQILAQNGYSTIYDLGGIIAWSEAGFPVQ